MSNVEKEPLVFNLDVIEIPVKIGPKDYVLVEASGGSVCKYKNAMLGTTSVGADGKPILSMSGMVDSEPLLVSLCLWELWTNEANGDIVRKPVHINTVKSWPDRIQSSLYKKAKEISNLQEDEDTIESLQKEQDDLDKRKAVIENSQVKN